MSDQVYELLKSQVSYKVLCNLQYSFEGNLLEMTDTVTASAQIEFFQYILDQIQPNAILETGTNKGFFAYLLSHILKKPATLYTFDLNPSSREVVRYLNNAQDRVMIQFFEGDTKLTLPSFNVSGIGFAWVDGGHDAPTTYNDVMNCIRLGIPYIAIDDTKLILDIQYVIRNVLHHNHNYELAPNPYYGKDSRGIQLLRKKL